LRFANMTQPDTKPQPEASPPVDAAPVDAGDEVEPAHPRDADSKVQRRAKYLSDAPGRVLRRYPATIGLIAAFVIVSLATGAAWRSVTDDPSLLEAVGYGTPALAAGKLWTFFIGGFVSPTLIWVYIPLIVAFAAASVPYERRAGHIRVLIVVIGGQALGTLITAALFSPFQDSTWSWAQSLAHQRDVGISGGLFALIAAFSALMQPVWRTRVRVGVSAFLVAMVLNSGLIWDVEHLFSWIVGLALGPLVMGRAPTMPTFKFGRRVQRPVVALIVAVVALTSLLDGIYPGNGGPFWDGGVQYDSGGVTLGLIVSSLILIACADGLRRGHRVAWVIVTVLIILQIIFLFDTPASAERTADLVLLIAPLILLLATATSFSVRSARRSVKRAGRRLLWVLGLLFAYTAIGFFALQDDFRPQATIADMIGEFFTRLFFSTTHAIEPATTAARWFVGSIGAVWIIAIVVTLIGLVYSSRRVRPDPEQDQRLREMLLTYDAGSIAWMNTWKGSTDWFSANGNTAIGYRVVGAVALALGDPIGPLEERQSALREYDSFCVHHGWLPCFFGSNQQTADLVETIGWKAVQVAEDDIIPLPDLAFKGKSWQDVRTALNKAGKQDITLQVLNYADARPVITDQLYAISEGWVSDKSLPEMGFTLGTLREADDPDVRIHIAIDADQTVEGFTSWMPVSRDGKIVGWTLDLMRRREDKPTFRPVMEFLIGASAMQFKDEGFEFISLSAAPLARAPETLSGNSDQRVLQRLLDFLGDALEPYYGFRSLLAFKSKFQPKLEPMYLIFPDESALLEIGIAIARAYMPEATLVDWVKMSAEMVTTPAH
jgi:phosphatidylglycerol lysyltransferase